MANTLEKIHFDETQENAKRNRKSPVASYGTLIRRVNIRGAVFILSCYSRIFLVSKCPSDEFLLKIISESGRRSRELFKILSET